MSARISSFILSFIIIAISRAAFAGPGYMARPENPPPGGVLEPGMESHGRMHRGGGHMFFGDPEAMKVKLGLTDEQVDKIGKVNNEYKKKLLKVRDDIDPKMKKFHDMLAEENIDLNGIRALLNEISQLEVEIRMLRINQALDITKILTPDQRKQLRNLMRRMMGRLYRAQPDFLNNNDRVRID